MKKIIQSDFSRFLVFLFVFAVVFSCGTTDSDPPEEPLIPNQEGFFVFGSNTIAEDPTEASARMSRAVLDPSQGAGVENMEGVYGKFMYIGGNSTIEFLKFEDDVATSYGASGGGSVSHGEDVGNVSINDTVIHGSLAADGPAIQVSEEGLYYVFVNTIEDLFVIMKVKANIIGDATEAQWAEGTPIPQESVSADGAVFEVHDFPLNGHSGYRYRFNDGWHVYQGPDIVTLSSLGVPDYGAAWDSGVNDVGFHLDNIPHQEDGMFTVRLEFNASTGEWTETKTQTGELVVDYGDTEMGLFGNAFEIDGIEAEWDAGYGLHTPDVSGNIFTWTWNDVDLIEDREFIFLEDGEWGGVQIDYTGATIEGSAIDNEEIVDATSVGGEHHNFFVAAGGTYNISLVINAENGEQIITIDGN